MLMTPAQAACLLYLSIPFPAALRIGRRSSGTCDQRGEPWRLISAATANRNRPRGMTTP